MNFQVMLTGTAIALFATCAASDESRSGFYLSGGLGGHSTTSTVTSGSEEYSWGNFGLNTSLKIGGYLSSQWALYYQREASLWNDDEFDNSTVVAGMSGIGATYYLKPEMKSVYIEYGVGLGDFTDISTDTFSETGGGIVFGVGYEFTNYIQAGAVLTGTSFFGFAQQGFSLQSYEFSTRSIALKVELKL